MVFLFKMTCNCTRQVFVESIWPILLACLQNTIMAYLTLFENDDPDKFT